MYSIKHFVPFFDKDIDQLNSLISMVCGHMEEEVSKDDQCCRIASLRFFTKSPLVYLIYLNSQISMALGSISITSTLREIQSPSKASLAYKIGPNIFNLAQFLYICGFRSYVKKKCFQVNQQPSLTCLENCPN